MPRMNHAADEFLQLVLRECEISDGGLGAWLLSIPLNEGSADWISARPNGRVVPAQGWKLHVSATVVEANETLRRVLPLLVAERAAFKIVASPRRLHELNQGRAGLSQIGKFLTVYPIDPSEAVKMATALDQATHGLEGPVIPSDRPLRAGSAVHYRYGGFSSRVMQTLIGELVPAMTGVGGEVVPDLRAERYVPPEGIPDPFVVAGVATELRRPSQVLGSRFVMARSLSESARGSVELALDVQDLRRVVLKRAGRAAQAAANGRDASDRLRYEASVLASLAFDIGFPEPYELFVDGDGLVLAMEDIAGPLLLEYVSQFADECELPPVKEVLRWAQLLAASIGKLHAQGWVHRDLKPTNVVLADDGRLRLLDAEGTVQLGTIESAGLVTLGYCSPQQAGGAAAAVVDDVYAFGALLRFALTGSDSSSYLGGSAPVHMSVRWWNPHVSPMVAAVVERCLDPKPHNQFGSMDELQHALADIRAEADDPPCRTVARSAHGAKYSATPGAATAWPCLQSTRGIWHGGSATRSSG